MRLRLNGKVTEFEEGMTVAELLKELNMESRGVAVEVNMKILKRVDFEGFELNDGDSVEIVSFVGGG
jgi:thiamine biosynthesis protein ThiS